LGSSEPRFQGAGDELCINKWRCDGRCSGRELAERGREHEMSGEEHVLGTVLNPLHTVSVLILTTMLSGMCIVS